MSVKLRKLLEKDPDQVERFEVKTGFHVDFMRFNDRPYEGVNSIITNGLADYFESKPVELVITYDANSLDQSTDLNAFLATYIQLHYFDNHTKMYERNHFCIPGELIKGFGYTGVYATNPVYFPRNCFDDISEARFLWLIPIFQNEYDFIDRFGAKSFESFLVDNDPDMSKFDRHPLDMG